MSSSGNMPSLGPIAGGDKLSLEYGLVIVTVILFAIVFAKSYADRRNACLRGCAKKYKDCTSACAMADASVADAAIATTTSSFTPKKKSTFVPKKAAARPTHAGLENFLASRNNSDAVYDYHDPLRVPHGQDLDNASEWDPAKLSLEKDVFDSHREFTEDAYISTQGANSTDTIRDDPNDVNPWVGLRRPDYTGAFSESDARVVSSEYPDQMKSASVSSFVL